jgi:AcrR family transcriptional regulator
VQNQADQSSTPAPTTRKARAEETRRKLLAAAVHHFSRRHFDEVAVTEIAETAGVAHGLVHLYFQNKRGAYLAAVREAAAQLEAAHSPDREADAGEQIWNLVHTTMGFMAEHEHLALRLILGGGSADPEAWEIFEEVRWRAVALIGQLLDLDISNPALRLMLRSGMGAVDAAITYWLKNGRREDPEAITDALLNIVIASLDSATWLDPQLDVTHAVAVIRTGQNRSIPKPSSLHTHRAAATP